MSKGNMLLGQARGKVGSLVFSRSNGNQVVRTRAEVVKNPQTQAQMIQRIFMNTISQAYSNMAAIVDHSFQGIEPGQASMNYFTSTNLKALRERVSQAISVGETFDTITSFSPIGTSILVPNGYLMSKGKLPTIPVVQADAEETMGISLSSNTYDAFIQEYGLQRGDQITFVGIFGNTPEDASFSFARIILDPRNPDGTQAEMSSAFVANGGVNLPSPRNEGTLVGLSYIDSKLKFGFGSAFLMGAAVIVSRQNTDGMWMRSKSYMTANDAFTPYYNLQLALDALQKGGIGVMSPRYLNNAGTSRLPDDGGQGGTSMFAVNSVSLNGSAVSVGTTVLDNGQVSLAINATNNSDNKRMVIALVPAQLHPAIGMTWDSIAASYTTVGGVNPSQTTDVNYDGTLNTGLHYLCIGSQESITEVTGFSFYLSE